MFIRALVQYKIFGDDDYTYIESFEVQYSSNVILRLDDSWRQRVIRSLAKRKIRTEWIKDLSVEYVRD